LRADALVVVGSNDPTYAASKVFPYILARRPALFVFHENSLVLKFAQELETGVRVGFAGPADLNRAVEQVHAQWFAGGGHRTYQAFDETKFAAFTAASLTRKLAQIFDRAAATSGAPSGIPAATPAS
jgi:hypothetical protein